MNPSWLKQYGMLVAARDPQTSEIVTVSCRFCHVFGREKLDVRTRRNIPIATTKHWRKGSSGFRTDNFTAHLRTAHAGRWDEFLALSSDDRETLFKVETPYSMTINAHYGATDNHIRERIVPSIVDDVLKSMLLGDESGTTSLGSCFTFDVNDNSYTLKVTNKSNFHIVIGQVALGSSFRMTSESIARHRTNGALAYIGSISEGEVARYVQALTAMSLQRIGNILKDDRCWAFSIAFDGATNHGESYIDVRARFCTGTQISNVHLLAIPITVRHTGENMCNVVAILLAAVVGMNWNKKLVGIATDGAASMVGHVSGAVTRLERLCLPAVYRVWCGAHQLDLAVQDSFKTSVNASFQQPLFAFISYLRRQTNLKAEMGKVCPTVATTRWLSIGEVCHWLVSNRVQVQEYLDLKNPSVTPSDAWWVLLYLIRSIMKPVNICFHAVQGRDTLLQEQNNRFKALSERLTDMLGINRDFSGVDVLALAANEDIIQSDHQFIATRSGLMAFLEGCGSFPYNMFQTLTVLDQDSILLDVSKLVLKLCGKVNNLVATRDSRNAPRTSRAPPVLPHQLKALLPREFYSWVEEQRDRLSVSFTAQAIETIEEQFLALRSDTSVITAESVTGFEAFGTSWETVGVKYSLLRSFCGGLASVFPGTSVVESDFSVLNYEAHAHRRALTNLSLAGILHSKQWDDVRRIVLS